MTHARTLSAGLELELPLIDALSGESADGRALMAELSAAAHGPDRAPRIDTAFGVSNDDALVSFDNGYNNLELVLAPVYGRKHMLARLDAALGRQLIRLQRAMAVTGTAAVSLSEHPACALDADSYRRWQVPRPIYDYWIRTRGWHHAAGIDAKAQNGPTTGVRVADAIDALNLSLHAAPALIALYANSPFEDGAITRAKENRLTLWPRMFATAHHPGDRLLARLPAQPFADWADYLRWMFGPATRMQPVALGEQGYKGFEALFALPANSSLLAFLAGSPQVGRRIDNHNIQQQITPSLRHLEQLQYAQFLDARIRFGLRETVPVEVWLDAMNQPSGIEALLGTLASHCYIESRAAGTNLPDAALAGLPDGDIARSVIISASALQAGLIDNPASASALSRILPWQALNGLRDAAIRDGLHGMHDGHLVIDLVEQVLSLAADALPAEEQWMLAYPQHVMQNMANGADRALTRLGGLRSALPRRLLTVARERTMVSCPTPALAAD